MVGHPGVRVLEFLCVLFASGRVSAVTQAMARDTKLNPMLLTAGQLRKMIASFEVVGDRGRCGFRVPQKRLW